MFSILVHTRCAGLQLVGRVLGASRNFEFRHKDVGTVLPTDGSDDQYHKCWQTDQKGVTAISISG